MSDIEIAQAAKMKPIIDLAQETLGIPKEALDPYGHYKAKLSLDYIEKLKEKPDGKLILVTAMSPTPAGEGKTTTTVGLSDALNRIGKKTVACLREPSLGPVFGVKGGAAGGGYAQVVPMEDINLHFTGDLHAVSAAHNLLSAMVDNHIHQGNELNLDTRLVQWKRVMDMNDRALRKITVGQGGVANGFMRDDGFDISVASEVMAILCLSTSIADLRERLGKVVIGQTQGAPADRKSITAADLKAHGAMAALLKDALRPNVVQTLENNVTMIHGGPFANIAHGCNSYMASLAGIKLGDYCVTEAGFGADLGAEKFVDIKCRLTGLRPHAAVIVASIKALKHHGGCNADGYKVENVEAMKKGFANLDRHIHNIRENYGLPVVVSVNHFAHDTDAEVGALLDHLKSNGVIGVLAKHWANGGAGAEDLAKAVVSVVEASTSPVSPMKLVYPSEDDLWTKIRTVATKIYGASDISSTDGVKKKLATLSKNYPNFPVCIAKTQSSFSTDASKRGAPSGHVVEIKEVRLCAGAGFVVAICGDIMTMPGLPKAPSAELVDVMPDGRIVGLF
jgi:formate--tetrahydrofolate ligase